MAEPDKALDHQLRFAGFAGADLEVDEFDLGNGLHLRRTYAHFMMPQLMAFRRPAAGQPHPAPWIAAPGSRGIDISIELEVPSPSPLGGKYSTEETAWWIGALIRIAQAPYLRMPVLTDQPFASIPDQPDAPVLKPAEIEHVVFGPGDHGPVLENSTLEWVKSKWLSAGENLLSNERFITAFKAFDHCRFMEHNSASMLMTWGAIEQLFAPSKAELRFRVSALVASYLEDAGEDRLKLYQQIKKLYDTRSTAAHTSKSISNERLIGSWVLLRNALVRIVADDHLPTADELERRLFGCEPPPGGDVPVPFRPEDFQAQG